MLRNARFTILDEASSSIDLETDDKVRMSACSLNELENEVLVPLDPAYYPRGDGRVLGDHHRPSTQDRDRLARALRPTFVSVTDERTHMGTDYDRILVLNEGVIVEFDTPKALLQQEGSGFFRKMCEQSADWEEIQGMLAKKF